MGVVAYGSYLPFWRLDSDLVSAALGKNLRRRTRTVASYDQDTTTLAVEACRSALFSAPGSAADRLDSLVLATASPVYADKTNATTVHAALALRENVRANDGGASTRGGVAALIAALRAREMALIAMSDINTGLAGGPAETGYGDAAAAFMVGESSDVVAELLSTGSVTGEIGDRWREPGATWSKTWEERFSEGIYLEYGVRSVAAAVAAAHLSPSDITHFCVTGVAPRAAALLARASGVAADRVVDDLRMSVGYTGTAHPGLILASVLDAAEPGDVIAVVSLVDGSDTVILRATEALRTHRAERSVASQVASGNVGLTYLNFLIWTGQVVQQVPRRPEPERVAAPPAYRRGGWKFAFTGSECEECGTRHVPPQDVCMRCSAVMSMRSVNLANTTGTIVSHTVDRLGFSPAPPIVAAVVDLEGGGRFYGELTDVIPDRVAVGQRVEMTFRRLSTADGVANYFWKARPIGGVESGSRKS